MAKPNLTRNPPKRLTPTFVGVPRKGQPPKERVPVPMQQEFMQHIRKLQLTLCVVTASVKALRAQGADQDEDIAVVLQRYVGDALDLEIQKWDALMSPWTRPPTS